MRVAYITNIAPHYRDRLWQLLSQATEFEFHFFFGGSALGIKEIDFSTKAWSSFHHRLHRIQNWRFRKVIIWQSGFLPTVFFGNWDKFIFLGDMNLLSTWVGVFLAKLRGREVIFWGHGMSGRERLLKRWIRVRFLKMADINLVYGEHAKRLLVRAGIKEKDVGVVYNSLDYDNHKRLRKQVISKTFYMDRGYFSNSNLPVLIFIGRLTTQKKLHILINALSVITTNGQKANLIFIGDGPERKKLAEKARSLSGQIYFYGSCYDEEEIGRLLANATLCVSPGEVGLTAIHSLSFGTPVCTHDNMVNQMPEAEAIIEGKTGTFFSLQKNNLPSVIKNWLEQSLDRDNIRNNCYSIIDNYFNPYHQLGVFRSVLK